MASQATVTFPDGDTAVVIKPPLELLNLIDELAQHFLYTPDGARRMTHYQAYDLALRSRWSYYNAGEEGD